jgi:hypothetical protein
MGGGFLAIPEEIRQMASKITEAIGDIHGLTWQKPSGDYGHSGVRNAWTSFLNELEHQVGTMHRTAAGHSENLNASAARYSRTDIENGKSLDDIIPGGGFAGGLLPDSLKNGKDSASPTPEIGWGRAPDVLGLPLDDGMGEAVGDVADGAPAPSGGSSGVMDPNVIRRAQGLPPLPPDSRIVY